MSEDPLRTALKWVYENIVKFRQVGEKETTIQGVTIKLASEWRGYKRCPWPNCGSSLPMNSWSISDSSGNTVIVSEFTLHLAAAGHPLTEKDISAIDQQTLLQIYQGKTS